MLFPLSDQKLQLQHSIRLETHLFFLEKVKRHRKCHNGLKLFLKEHIYFYTQVFSWYIFEKYCFKLASLPNHTSCRKLYVNEFVANVLSDNMGSKKKFSLQPQRKKKAVFQKNLLCIFIYKNQKLSFSNFILFYNSKNRHLEF